MRNQYYFLHIPCANTSPTFSNLFSVFIFREKKYKEAKHNAKKSWINFALFGGKKSEKFSTSFCEMDHFRRKSQKSRKQPDKVGDKSEEFLAPGMFLLSNQPTN